MTLLKCPECSYQVVPTEAASCPSCGASIASRGISTPLATVQRTRKSLKAQEWLSAVILIVGFVFLVFTDYNSPIGWFMTLTGAGGQSSLESAFGGITIRQRDPIRPVTRTVPIMQRL